MSSKAKKSSKNQNSNVQKDSCSAGGTVTLYSQKLEILIGGKVLINEFDIAINAGTKYFVLGCNGIGKTTMLKQIYQSLKDKLDILMIDQDIEIESGSQTIAEFILKADPELYLKKIRLDELENMTELSDEMSDEYNTLSEFVYEAKSWDKYESESKRIINGLGFTNPNTHVSILSGGKRMILAIGKALLRKPDILILDEPTNHLDLNVVIWLTN